MIPVITEERMILTLIPIPIPIPIPMPNNKRTFWKKRVSLFLLSEGSDDEVDEDGDGDSDGDGYDNNGCQ